MIHRTFYGYDFFWSKGFQEITSEQWEQLQNWAAYQRSLRRPPSTVAVTTQTEALHASVEGGLHNHQRREATSNNLKNHQGTAHLQDPGDTVCWASPRGQPVPTLRNTSQGFSSLASKKVESETLVWHFGNHNIMPEAQVIFHFLPFVFQPGLSPSFS